MVDPPGRGPDCQFLVGPEAATNRDRAIKVASKHFKIKAQGTDLSFR